MKRFKGGEVMSKELSKELLDAYRNAVYQIFKEKEKEIITLTVGSKSEELIRLIINQNVISATFITAFNPKSVILSEEENASRNEELRKDIANLKLQYFEGVGFDATNTDWLPEKHFLILGLDRDHSINLAKKYDQNAILYIENDGYVELLLTN